MGSDLQTLADRLEGLSGADRKTDAMIACALEPGLSSWEPRPTYEDGCLQRIANPGWTRTSEQYTSSLDAVVALVERVLPGWRVDYIQQMLSEPYWTAGLYRRVNDSREIERASSAAPTAPLAILRALVAAKIEEAKTRAKALSDLAEMDAEEIAAISTTSGVD